MYNKTQHMVPESLHPVRKKIKNRQRQIKINTNNNPDLSQIKESANEESENSVSSSDDSVEGSETKRSHQPDIFKSGTIDKTEFALNNTDPDDPNDVNLEIELKYQNDLDEQRNSSNKTPAAADKAMSVEVTENNESPSRQKSPKKAKKGIKANLNKKLQGNTLNFKIANEYSDKKEKPLSARSKNSSKTKNKTKPNSGKKKSGIKKAM